MRQVYRYAPKTVAAAYARSAIGLGATLGPLAALQPAPWLCVVLLVGAALFLVYLAKSVALHTTQVVLDEKGIGAEGLFGATIAWDALRSIQLNYYTTRSDRSNGWVEFVIRGASGLIRIESSLEGFADIVARVAREALRRERPLDDRTRAHFAALGIDLGAQSALGSASSFGARHA
jgi:hypothetical protein